MYVEFVARPETEELQVCCMPSAVNSGDPLASAARIVVVFTTGAEATATLTLARFLAVSDTRIWLVCPITPTLLGRLRLERFIRFARKCLHAIPAETLNRLRILAYPCTAGADPVEEFTCTRAVVLIRTRWWRPWGRGVGDAIISQADGPSLIL
jgi:hypothetical protein